MTVYFIKNVDNPGQIKIGSSESMERRLKAIASAVGAIQLFATCDGDVVEERYFQKRFSHLRVEGEWFSEADELMSFIRDNADACDVVITPSEPVWKTKIHITRRDADIDLAANLLASRMSKFHRSVSVSEAMEASYQELCKIGDGWTRRRVRSFHERTPLRVDFYEILDLMKLAGLSGEQALEIVTTGSAPSDVKADKRLGWAEEILEDGK